MAAPPDLPRAKPLTSKTATIAAGAAVSDAIDLTSGSLLMIIGPPNWTPANVSFLISENNVNYADLYDSTGTEILKPMGPNRAYLVDPSLTQAALWLKLRSGPLANPVVQAADRVFTLSIG